VKNTLESTLDRCIGFVRFNLFFE